MARKMVLAALFIALGVVTAHIVYIPVGVSRCFPVQHAINVLAGVLLGPAWSVGTAFGISLLRNLLGTGSLLAFPGSMCGALLAGLLYARSKNTYWAAGGELFGTGILGALLAFPLANFILGQSVLAWFFIFPFVLSSAGGCIIALGILKAGILQKK